MNSARLIAQIGAARSPRFYRIRLASASSPAIGLFSFEYGAVISAASLMGERGAPVGADYVDHAVRHHAMVERRRSPHRLASCNAHDGEGWTPSVVSSACRGHKPK